MHFKKSLKQHKDPLTADLWRFHLLICATLNCIYRWVQCSSKRWKFINKQTLYYDENISQRGLLNHACSVRSGVVICWGSFKSCCKGERDQYWMHAPSNLPAVQKANPECNTTKILLLSACEWPKVWHCFVICVCVSVFVRCIQSIPLISLYPLISVSCLTAWFTVVCQS